MTKDDIIWGPEIESDSDGWEPFFRSEQVKNAMDIWAKQQAIEFFKWNAKSISDYLDYLKRVNGSEGLEEMELELNHFENSSIEGRYNLFIECQIIESQNK